MKSSPWTIGELAARFGLATHVLRHWEDVGLLTPSATPAGAGATAATSWCGSP